MINSVNQNLPPLVSKDSPFLLQVGWFDFVKKITNFKFVVIFKNNSEYAEF